MAHRDSAQVKKVLLAEDDEGQRELLIRLLRDEGLEVTAVAGGEEAVERLRQRPFDLILTDLRMPDRDGIAVLQEAKRRCPDVPVVLMTCYGDMDTYMEAMDEGAFEYLNKPVVREDLEALVRRTLADPERDVPRRH